LSFSINKGLSRKTKRLSTVRLDGPVIRDRKPLSVDLDRPISDLLAEAIADLVRKHGRAEVVYSTVAPESKKGKE
jgi:hypothetical protein